MASATAAGRKHSLEAQGEAAGATARTPSPEDEEEEGAGRGCSPGAGLHDLTAAAAPAQPELIAAPSAAEAAPAAAAEAPPAPRPAKRARRLPLDEELSGLEGRLGYRFTDKWLLRQALLHPSFGEFNNARLTWLGDAVLTAAVSELVYRALPEATTAKLHEERCGAVRREACAERARRLGLSGMLLVGRSYEGQEPSVNMLAEAYEALWGAIYEDSGFSMAAIKKVYFAVEGGRPATNGSAEP